jgi:hypothetical protein
MHGLIYFWSQIRTKLNNKVDKVSGKGLSTNDYTTTEKDKLAGIESGANKYSHPNSGVTAGSYTKVTVNAAGHVTAISTKTVKIPASDNTWRGIQDNLTSTSKSDSLSAAQGKLLQDNKVDKIEETALATLLDEIFGA